MYLFWGWIITSEIWDYQEKLDVLLETFACRKKWTDLQSLFEPNKWDHSGDWVRLLDNDRKLLGLELSDEKLKTLSKK